MSYNLDAEIARQVKRMRMAATSGALEQAFQIFKTLRAEHGVDLFYEVEFPEHIRFVHPTGTVLGRATYGDYLVVYQGCGVGSTIDRRYPVIGEGVVLFPGAKVLGGATIGDNVLITANTVVYDQHVPSNSVAYPVVVNGRVRAGWTHTELSVKEHYFP